MKPKTFKELRETRFTSQGEFARALGVSKATVCGWEIGKRLPSIQQIMQIAKIFEVHRYVVFDIFVANINDITTNITHKKGGNYGEVLPTM